MINITAPSFVLAQNVDRAGLTGESSRDSDDIGDVITEFFKTEVGQTIDRLLDVGALCAVLWGFWVIAKALKSSNPGSEIVKKGLWPFVVAALLFNIDWTITIVDTFVTLIGRLISTVSSLLGL